MCTELLLAIIYLITLFVINYFLYNFLRNSFSKSLYFLKLLTILKIFKKKDLFLFLNLYNLYINKNSKKSLNLQIKDNLILGNIYEFLFKTKKEKKILNSNFYYFSLLILQYFPKKK